MASEPLFSENDFDSLLTFLNSEDIRIRQVASQGILELSGGTFLETLSSNHVSKLVLLLFRRFKDTSDILQLTLQTLINFTAHPHVFSFVAQNHSSAPLSDVVSLILADQTASSSTDLACMLLANLTRHPSLAQILLDMPSLTFPRSHLHHRLTTAPTALHQLIEVFSMLPGKASKAEFHYLSAVFANISQLESSFSVFMDPAAASPLDAFVCFLSHPSVVRRGGVVRLLRNMAMTPHPFLLNNTVLVPLLGRLAPASFYELDECMDHPVYEILHAAQCEPDTDLQKVLLETLLLCTATRASRDTLRNAGAYLVLREYHRTCPDNQKDVLETIVDLLMRDEAPEVPSDNHADVVAASV